MSNDNDIRVYSGQFGEAFPHDSPVAQFIVSVGAALNDLVFVGKLSTQDIYKGFDAFTPSERIYLFRLAMSHVYEFGILIRDASRVPDVRSFLEDLEGEIKKDLDAMQDFSSDEKPIETARHVIRNKTTFHYECPPSKVMSRVLKELADHEAELHLGKQVKDSRAEFADAVLVNMATPIDTPGTNMTEADRIKALMTAATERLGLALRLAQSLIGAYVVPGQRLSEAG